MEKIRQIFLLPADTLRLNTATVMLDGLGLSYEVLPEIVSSGTTLIRLAVDVLVIPVLHVLHLEDQRSSLHREVVSRLRRPSHSEARSWRTGALITAYPDDFFSDEKRFEQLCEVIVREHIIRHFAAQGIIVRKISFSKPVQQVLGAARYFPMDEWVAFVEEARYVLPDLSQMLGALEQ